MPKTPLALYRAHLATGELEADAAQLDATESLDRLARELDDWRPRRGHLRSLFARRRAAPKGLYIHGGVGRGKTMLMDLFYETSSFAPKGRVHFHEFMAEVHARIGVSRKRQQGDPIPHVGRQFAAEAALLCFDELHVTDIADAMILGRLFKVLFEQQTIVVSTSNVPPNDLYKNGLNRQLFLPFIDLIEEHMQVLELKAAKDFRLDKLAGTPLYFTPVDAKARAEMDGLWLRLVGHSAGAPLDLDVAGRTVRVPLAAMGVARFPFSALCERPLGALDYLHVAHAFHTVLIDAIPALRPAQRDVARRFVNLIDTLYDNRVCLVASADTEPNELYPAGDGAFLFERTASRLMEMRSQAYLDGRMQRIKSRTQSTI
jgi:cell division protein ZapE